MGIWGELGIEATKDKELITKAYRDRLVKVNPEVDSQGFMKLRNAYEEAMKYADTIEEEDNTPIGKWIKKIEANYMNYPKRIDENSWKELLEDEICLALDTKEEARDSLLTFLMSHYVLPQKVWMLFDKEYDIKNIREELYEKFPKDFINYGVIYNIDNPDTIDFDSFEIDEDLDYDTFINLYIALKKAMRGNDREEINKIIEDMDSLGIEYPYFDIEKAVLYIRDSKQTEAIEILERINRLLPNKLEVNYLLGVSYSSQDKVEEALVYYNYILENLDENDFSGKNGKAYCLMKMGQLEEARDLYADILEEDPHNQNADEYYHQISEQLIDVYKKYIAEEPGVTKHKISLAWVQMHTRKIDDALKTLENIEPQGDEIYKYYNILAHCNIGNENFDVALSYFIKWEEVIRKLIDSKEEDTKKQIRRLGYTIFRQGGCYVALKNYEKAIELTDKALEIDPKDIMFYSGKASIYMELKEYQKAVDVCDEALLIDDNNGDIFSIRFRALFELGFYQDSFDDCNNCIRVFPFFLQAYIYKIKILLIYEEYEDAKEIFDYLKESGVTYDEIDVLYGQYLINKTDSTAVDESSAKKLYNELIKKYSEKSRDERNFSLHYVYYIQAVFIEKENPQQALSFIEKAIEEKHDYIGAYYFKGKLLEKLNKKDEAITIYKKVLEINPKHQYANCAIAEIYDEREEYEKALIYHTAQLENAQSLYYFVNRGLAYMAIDKFEEARSDYYEGIKCDPDNPHPYNNIGVTYQYEDQLDKAVENYLEGLKRIENEPATFIYRNMITTLNRLGRYDEAIKYHDIVIKRFNKPFDYKEKAMTLRYACRPAEAIKAIDEWKRVVEYNAENTSEYNSFIGQCYFEMGDLKNAEKYLKAAKNNSQNASEELGYYYMHKMDYKKAIKAFEKERDYHQRNLYLAMCYNYLKKYDKAKAIADKGLEQVNNIGENQYYHLAQKYYLKGALLLEAGRDEEAIIELKKAYKRRKCNTCDFAKCHEASYRIGIYYERKTDYEKALEYFQEALDINPSSVEYRDAVAKIRKKMKR